MAILWLTTQQDSLASAQIDVYRIGNEINSTSIINGSIKYLFAAYNDMHTIHLGTKIKCA